MPLTILEGSTFCICDELGDIGADATSGFFSQDTRYLSTYRLTVNGLPPLVLSSHKVDYFSAIFYLRNPVENSLPQDSLLVRRERFVGEAMQELEPRERRELRVDVFPVERGDVRAFDASWDVRLAERHVTVERS